LLASEWLGPNQQKTWYNFSDLGNAKGEHGIAVDMSRWIAIDIVAVYLY
jgi:hypothetical protein